MTKFVCPNFGREYRPGLAVAGRPSGVSRRAPTGCRTPPVLADAGFELGPARRFDFDSFPSQQTTKFPPTPSIRSTSASHVRMINVQYCPFTVITIPGTIPYDPALFHAPAFLQLTIHYPPLDCLSPRTRRKRRKPFPLMRLLYNFPHPGVGGLPPSSGNSVHGARPGPRHSAFRLGSLGGRGLSPDIRPSQTDPLPSSPHPEPRPLAARVRRFPGVFSLHLAQPTNSVSPTPFTATLLPRVQAKRTSHLQIAEKPATLTPAFATLTSRVKDRSGVCHSYKKHLGVKYRSVFRRDP
jgi:hypothetical protein